MLSLFSIYSLIARQKCGIFIAVQMEKFIIYPGNKVGTKKKKWEIRNQKKYKKGKDAGRKRLE